MREIIPIATQLAEVDKDIVCLVENVREIKLTLDVDTNCVRCMCYDLLNACKHANVRQMHLRLSVIVAPEQMPPAAST